MPSLGGKDSKNVKERIEVLNSSRLTVRGGRLGGFASALSQKFGVVGRESTSLSWLGAYETARGRTAGACGRGLPRVRRRY